MTVYIRKGLSILVLLLVSGLLSLQAGAVMMPGRAARDLGRENVLSKKGTRAHFTEIRDLVDDLEMAPFPLITSSFPYILSQREVESKASSSITAAIYLNSLFNYFFQSLSKDKFLLYREIFYGYKTDPYVSYEQSISRKSSNEYYESNNPLYALDTKSAQFRIHIPVSLRASPLLDQTARLLALLENEFRDYLVEKFGGPKVLYATYPKVFMLTEMYTKLMTYEVFNGFSRALLREQLDRSAMVKYDKRSIQSREHAFIADFADDDSDYANIFDWTMRNISGIPGDELSSEQGPEILEVLAETINSLIQKKIRSEARTSWAVTAAESNFVLRRGQILEWWKKVSSEHRLTIIRLAHQNKDGALESLLAETAIIISGPLNCVNTLQ